MSDYSYGKNWSSCASQTHVPCLDSCPLFPCLHVLFCGSSALSVALSAAVFHLQRAGSSRTATGSPSLTLRPTSPLWPTTHTVTTLGAARPSDPPVSTHQRERDPANGAPARQPCTSDGAAFPCLSRSERLQLLQRARQADLQSRGVLQCCGQVRASGPVAPPWQTSSPAPSQTICRSLPPR